MCPLPRGTPLYASQPQLVPGYGCSTTHIHRWIFYATDVSNHVTALLIGKRASLSTGTTGHTACRICFAYVCTNVICYATIYAHKYVHMYVHIHMFMGTPVYLQTGEALHTYIHMSVCVICHGVCMMDRLRASPAEMVPSRSPCDCVDTDRKWHAHMGSVMRIACEHR